MRGVLNVSDVYDLPALDSMPDEVEAVLVMARDQVIGGARVRRRIDGDNGLPEVSFVGCWCVADLATHHWESVARADACVFIPVPVVAVGAVAQTVARISSLGGGASTPEIQHRLGEVAAESAKQARAELVAALVAAIEQGAAERMLERMTKSE